MNNPHFFGIRHLSPAGAYFLREYLDEKKPKLVLIEGPSDFDDMLGDMVRQETEFHHIGASAARDGHSCFLRMCMIHKVMY